MYESVYERMVHAKVAIELENPVSYDVNGNIAGSNSTKVFGVPTKYQATNPEHILFVDKCGSNTNQKSDGQVGGHQFVICKDGNNTGTLGSNMDLHFTVLCFITQWQILSSVQLC
jgi:hypothetical protein